MKVKLHPYKIANLVIVYVLFFGVVIYTSLNNSLRTSQQELKQLYDTGLSNCEITNILEKPFSGGRGTYRLFTTDCHSDYFPISPEPFAKPIVELFVKGATVTKVPKSTMITVTNKNVQQTVEFKNYKDEDSRPLTLKIIGVLLLVLTTVILLVPNSMYDKWVHNKR